MAPCAPLTPSPSRSKTQPAPDDAKAGPNLGALFGGIFKGIADFFGSLLGDFLKGLGQTAAMRWQVRGVTA